MLKGILLCQLDDLTTITLTPMLGRNIKTIAYSLTYRIIAEKLQVAYQFLRLCKSDS